MTKRQAAVGDRAYRTTPRRRVAASLVCAAALVAFPSGAGMSAPIKVAVFDFELEDFSAAASTTGETPSDAAQLASATGEVRDLFKKSGRYDVINIAGADAAAKAHTLRYCDGCDATIALKLGAEQSFVGVVKRISRTEYTVRFQIRDARTGAVLSTGDSGLRMGANYSWSRGAARLIEDRVLASQTGQ